MAAAARPGTPHAGDPRDARVPCAQCGGLIHPIAGKCKHCKADLTAYRAARPAANAPLPALLQTVATSIGQPAAPVAHAVTMPAAARSVLPPRPTAAAHPAEPTSAWRSWPVVVIIVAVMAIVAAVVIMMWPAHAARDGKRALQPPPAPERMDTQIPPAVPKADSPQPPHAAAPPAAGDPSGAPSGSPPAPSTDPPADPSAQADPDGSDDQDGLFDSLAPPTGARTRGRGNVMSGFAGALGLAMTSRLCHKLFQCGTSDDTLKPLCEAIANLPSDPPAGCPAAERCLRHIDALGCTSQPDALQMGMLLMQFRDCAEAARC